MNITTENIELLKARAVIYSFISALFTRPDEDKFMQLYSDEMKQQILDAAGDLDVFYEMTDWSFRGSVTVILTALENEKHNLVSGHVNLFGHTLSKKAAPYETEHLENQEVFYKTQWLADISGFYRAFGLQMGSNERVDFISAEAEFLTFLVFKEILALEQRLEKENLEVVRKAQQDFWKEHFSGWIPKFSNSVIESAELDFYKESGKFLQQFHIAENKYFS